ncbi:MAG: methyltransferase [Desulfarculaceae bacterium]|nr:methyltransferase [Desulfarculaceae bacterium]
MNRPKAVKDSSASPGGRGSQTTHDRLGPHYLEQPAQGFRFAIDSVLLADFATTAGGPVADLGAGCGVLCVLLAARGLAGPFSALEIDPLAAGCCERNFSRAGLDGRVLAHDLSQPHPGLKPGSFALVISNPPFGRPGRGRLSPDPARARARHELALTAEDLWQRAKELLAPGARLALCWPPSRLPQALAGLTALGLAPRRLRLVHGRVELPAKICLIEAVKDGGEELGVEPPLIVYDQGQEYGPEVAAIYQRLC